MFRKYLFRVELTFKMLELLTAADCLLKKFDVVGPVFYFFQNHNHVKKFLMQGTVFKFHFSNRAVKLSHNGPAHFKVIDDANYNEKEAANDIQFQKTKKCQNIHLVLMGKQRLKQTNY